MRNLREVAETGTAFLSTLVAGMSLTLPINFAWTSESSALQLNMMSYNLPRSIAAGVIIALIVAVFATTVNHGLAAWGSALFGIAITFVNHVMGRHVGPSTSLSTLNFIDAIGAGILIGGTAAAILHTRPQVFGWTLGALCSIVLGAALPGPHGETRATDSGLPVYSPASDTPPMWLIVVTLFAIAVGTFVNRHRTGIERRTFELPMAPILAGTLFVGVTLFGNEWLGRHEAGLLQIGLAVAATIAAGLVATALLPRRDGTLALSAIALAAVGAALIPTHIPSWSAIPLIAAIGAGILLGFRHPAPVIGLIALCAVALAGAETTAYIHTPLHTAAFATALAALTGFSFSSAAPRYNPSRVLGLAIVFMPSVVASLRDRAEHSDYRTVTVQDGRWSYGPIPAPDTSTPYWTALAITVGCLLGLLALRRWRSPTIPATGQALADR
ncbi:hypothetical protein ACWDSJ_13745 [Nocardia sp. NPDC003482]